MRTNIIKVVGALVVLAGCDVDSERDADPPFVVIDSAGILISVTSGQEARKPMDWTVDSIPDLVLGAGDEPSDFIHRVQGLKGLPDGGVLLVDSGGLGLRFFDHTGRLVRRVGGRGRGPGEFMNPVLVPVQGVDSLLVFDGLLPWFQVFAPDGQFSRMIHHVGGRPYGGRAPVGSIGFRYMLIDASGTLGGAEAPQPQRGVRKLESKFLWWDAVTGRRHTADSVTADMTYIAGSGAQAQIPFAPRSAAVVTEAGALITRGSSPDVFYYEPLYDEPGYPLRRILRVHEAGRPVTRELIDLALEANVAEQVNTARLFGHEMPEAAIASYRSRLEEVYRDMPFPDTLPFFQAPPAGALEGFVQRRALLVDELGWLWALSYKADPDQATTWVVFDPDGRARGTVRTPPGLRVEWIGEDALLGVRIDDMGVEYVKRHRLRR